MELFRWTIYVSPKVISMFVLVSARLLGYRTRLADHPLSTDSTATLSCARPSDNSLFRYTELLGMSAYESDREPFALKECDIGGN